jgi:DNA polymerase-3 subunit beta
MELKIDQEALSNRLNLALAIIPPKTPFPILSNVMVKAGGDELSITATNLDISVTTSLEAAVSGEGSQTIPARRWWEIVKELPSGQIDVSGKEGLLKMVSSTGEYQVMCPQAEDFPQIPELEREKTFSLDMEILNRLIDKTSYAVLADGTRPVLSGVLLEYGPFGIRSVATDGHRLVFFELSGPSGESALKAVVPPKALSLLARVESAESVDVFMDEGDIWFTSGSDRVYSKLISGNFPDYEQVIPKDNDKFMLVDKDRILASVRRVSILSQSDTHQVKLSVSSGKLTVSASAADIGEAHEEIEVDYDGEDFEIAFNARYLLDSLRHVDGERVKLGFKTSVSACVIEPESPEVGEKQLCLIMPLHPNE